MSTVANHNIQSGVISEVYPNMCKVILNDDPTKRLLCTYRRGKVIERKPQDWIERSPVAPGDSVDIAVLGSKDGIVEKIHPRRNCLQRKAPGKEGNVLHTLAANIDQVVIVASLHEPEFSPGLVDRFLIATQAAEIKPLLVINKMDLNLDAGSPLPWQLYLDLGVECFPMSTQNKVGIEQIKERIQNQVSVFCGHSGVGKTSLLNLLNPDHLAGRVGTVNAHTGKGKHTTTVSSLTVMPDGSRYIDTPGIREFGLFKISPKELIRFFPEIEAAQAKGEPIEQLPRYSIYTKIRHALETEGR